MRFFAAFLFLSVVCPTTLTARNTLSTAVVRKSGADASPAYHLETRASNLIAAELGGQAASDPACCSNNKVAYCFVRGFNGYAYYKKVGSKGPWLSLGLWILGEVACVAHGDDVTVILVEGGEHRLVTNTISKGKLLGRQYTKAYHPQEVPGCVGIGNDITCMYRGVYGLSFMISRINGKWGPAMPQGGLLYSPIAMYYSPATKEMSAFATSSAYHLQIYTKTPTDISYWKEEGVFVMSGKPSVCSRGGKSLDIFTLGPGNNLLWLRRNASGVYQEWLNEGGDIIYPPTCLGSTNHLDCFSVSPDFYISKKVWRGSSWTRWEKIVWGYVGQPSCHFVPGTVKSITCYVRSIETSGVDAFTFHA